MKIEDITDLEAMKLNRLKNVVRGFNVLSIILSRYMGKVLS